MVCRGSRRTYSSVLMSASSLSGVKGLLVAVVVDERSSVAAAAERESFIAAKWRCFFVGIEGTLRLPRDAEAWGSEMKASMFFLWSIAPGEPVGCATLTEGRRQSFIPGCRR